MLAGLAAGIALAVLAAPTPGPAGSDAPAFHFVQVGGRSVLPAAEASRVLTVRVVPVLRAQLEDVPLSDVHCASDVVADGRKQVCSIAIDGAQLRIRVTAFDLGTGTGPIWIHTDESLLDLRKIEKAGLGIVQGINPTVTSIACNGPRWRPTEVDEMFACNAQTSDGKPARILVRSTSDMGEVDLRVIP